MQKFLLGLGLTVTTLFGCKTQNLENSNLWEISGNGLEEPSYLLGTIHIGCNLQLPEVVYNTMDKADLLVLEADMDDPAYNQIDPASLMMADNQSLSDFFSEEEEAKVKNFINGFEGLNYERLKHVKPYYTQFALITALLSCDIEGVEVKLMNHLNGSKEIEGLETFDFQNDLFDEIPYKDQARCLLVMAERGEASSREDFYTMVDLYNKQDVQGMYEYTSSDPAIFPLDFLPLILDNRNADWIPKIDKLSKDQSVFYAVGAGHLGGEKGVINLLREAGYTLTPIKK
ncbi:TraB/GumN family protein [Gilvibacter sediminis]|uniref:TraB/GumN family protein n=1 Tax=Gilvibacter sediminis TaxID=379071 RepID=UPI0023500481|nr:TraB/GumN family protein [Gilvibacter sediminis]MDC7997878.1 TraB/GumN family protein [Gilvibacter sediminis]